MILTIRQWFGCGKKRGKIRDGGCGNKVWDKRLDKDMGI